MFHRGFGPRELLIKSRNQIILTITSFSIINHQSSYQEYQALLPETSVFARSRAVKIFSTILTHLQRAIIFTNVHHIDIESLQQGAVGPEVARLVTLPANLHRGLHSASSKSIASTGGGFLALRNLLPPWCCLRIEGWWLLPPPLFCLAGRDGASKIFPRQASSSSKLTPSSRRHSVPH